jgi:hypothetical protein
MKAKKPISLVGLQARADQRSLSSLLPSSRLFSLLLSFGSAALGRKWAVARDRLWLTWFSNSPYLASLGFLDLFGPENQIDFNSLSARVVRLHRKTTRKWRRHVDIPRIFGAAHDKIVPFPCLFIGEFGLT